MSERPRGRDALLPDEALRLVVGAAPKPEVETVGLAEALGRVLAGEARALVDQPPFDKSAMDGFAHPSGLPAPEGPWRVAGTMAARALPEAAGGIPSTRPGEVVRIMTGAMLPPGARAVQRVEWTEALPSSPGSPEEVRFTRAEKWDNVIRRGENQRTGDLLFRPRMLCPQDIGILASSGYSELRVARRPKVVVVSTGDELRLPVTGERSDCLAPGLIFDSNGPQLLAQALACGCDASFLGIVPDDEEALTGAFAEALAGCDVLVVSGGVSMGDFDHVPRALARAGVATVFHGLAMRPGKPFFFGTTESGAAAFGLPGNPVSTFVGFEVLVRPHVAARTGFAWEPRLVGARLAAPLERRETDRVDFLPARLEPGQDGLPSVRPVAYKGSSMLAALSEADCLISIGVGVGSLAEGRIVDARLLRP